MTKEEFNDWRHHRVTEEVFHILGEARDAYIHSLASGSTLESLTDTAKTVGTIQAFDFLLNIQFEGPEND